MTSVRFQHHRAPGRAVFGAVALVLVTLAAIATPSAADDRYKGVRVASVTVRGLDDDLAEKLKAGLALAQTSGLLGGNRPTFYPDILDQDLRRCRLFLARRGYPYASITTEFKPQGDERMVAITIHVNPGPAVIVAGVTVSGIPERLAGDADNRVELDTGRVFADAAAEETRTAIKDLLRENGYARADVTTRLDWPESTAVQVHFTAAPGERYRFGEKLTTGTRDDLVPLVVKSMETERGQWYSPKAVERSRDNLRLLDLFRQVRVQTVEAGGDTLDVRADLIERDARLFEAGLGYWSDDLVRGRARWMHRNLFRRGRGFSVGGSASVYKQTGTVSAWWPAIIGSRTRLTTSYQVERQDEDNYDLLQTGVDVNLTYQYSIRTSARVGAKFSNVDLDVSPEASAELEIEDGRLTVLSLRLARNGADDRLYPTRGTVSWFDIQWSPPGAMSDNHFVSAELSGTLYQPLGKGVVLALRAKAGAVEPISESVDVLPNFRFYSGGSSSMRGYKRRRLGPLDAANDPLGGESKVEAAAELRFPLFWRFRGAMFIDSGQVWERSNDTSLSDLAVAVGPGLRLVTPIGPIRADLGYRATDDEVGADEPRWVFHISIGPAF